MNTSMISLLSSSYHHLLLNDSLRVPSHTRILQGFLMLTVVIWEAFEASFKSLKFQRNALVVCVDKNYFLCLTTTTLQKVASVLFLDLIANIARNEVCRYIIFDSFIFKRKAFKILSFDIAFYILMISLYTNYFYHIHSIIICIV